MDRGNIFERLLRSNLADILTPLVTMTRKCPRPAYAQCNFDQLWADFQELTRYFSALRTLKLIREGFGFQ